MSLAEKMAAKICELGLTARTLREWLEATNTGNDIAVLQNDIHATILTAIQKRIDFDDYWLDFAALPEKDKGNYPDEFINLVYKNAAAGYARGYIEGFMDRELLFANLKASKPEELDD